MYFGHNVGSIDYQMTILSNGNIGIGETIPGYKLEVENTGTPNLTMKLNHSGATDATLTM